MPDEYTTESKYWRTAQVSDIELFVTEGGERRIVLRTEQVKNARDPAAALRATLLYQRRNADGEWEDIKDKDFRNVRKGETVPFPLRSAPTLKLYRHLQNLYEVYAQMGILPGQGDLVVGLKDEVIPADPERAGAIRDALAADQPMELLEALAEQSPVHLSDFLRARQQGRRAEALHEFEVKLSQEHTEPEWKNFFEANEWIFGYGLNFVFHATVRNQAPVRSSDITGLGEQVADHVLRTVAAMSFTVAVEIKRPDSSLLGGRYRNGAWVLHQDLIEGVVQAQANRRALLACGERRENIDRLESQGIYTVEPKGILVIGNTAELQDRDPTRHRERLMTFQGFRRNLVNPEIITYDELLARARFIVEGAPEPEGQEAGDGEPFDDVPF